MKTIKCPECDAEVVASDNNVYLDYPSEEYDEVSAPWTLMRFGRQAFASVGNPGIDNKGHHLHLHQPPESVMAQ